MTEILDSNGTRITEGADVIDKDGNVIGTVLELTEPDGDVNEYGRPVAVGPYVTVGYDNDSIERWTATWNATGPWDDTRTDYTCDDVTVARRGEGVDLAAVEALEKYAAETKPISART